jgi:anti-anti-sigma regulatory factor
LTAAVTDELRAAIQACSKHGYSTIYLDVKEVKEIDLSGVNEIIHAYYSLLQASQQLILEYRKDSTVDKWVRTTGIDRFLSSAIFE